MSACVTSLSWSPNGRLLAGASEGAAGFHVWDAASGRGTRIAAGRWAACWGLVGVYVWRQGWARGWCLAGVGELSSLSSSSLCQGGQALQQEGTVSQPAAARPLPHSSAQATCTACACLPTCAASAARQHAALALSPRYKLDQVIELSLLSYHAHRFQVSCPAPGPFPKSPIHINSVQSLTRSAAAGAKPVSKLRWSPDGGRLLVAAADSSFQVRAHEGVLHLVPPSGMQHGLPYFEAAAACWPGQLTAASEGDLRRRDVAVYRAADWAACWHRWHLPGADLALGSMQHAMHAWGMHDPGAGSAHAALRLQARAGAHPSASPLGLSRHCALAKGVCVDL